MGRTSNGWRNGFIGMLIFSGSLPATRIAVLELEPLFLTGARGAIAGLLALCALVLARQQRPTRRQWHSLALVALGVVLGFPLLTALALQQMTSAHSMVFMGMLPLSTAVFGVLRGGERPQASFWCFSLLGNALVMAFALSQGLGAAWRGDLLMLLAIAVCGLGYAEGARLSRELGGWQVICWALVLSLPAMLLLAGLRWPANLGNVGAAAWLGLAYVSVFSMLIGFVFWYRGLAQGGIAAVGQLQLLQPFFGLALAAGLLHEAVSPGMVGVTLAVIGCVAGARHFAPAR